MNRSRKRQFDGFRSQINSSVHSETNSVSNSRLSSSTVSQACVNCVNKIMADRRHHEQKQRVQKQRAEYRQLYSSAGNWSDSQANYINQMKKDALKYNQGLISHQKEQAKKQKQIDLMYAQKTEELIAEAENARRKQQQEAKLKETNYFQQIRQQYLEEEEKKAKNFRKKINNEEQQVQSLPLWNNNRQEQIMKHGNELLLQIEEKRKAQEQQQREKKENEKRILKQSEKQSLKYHADNYKEKKLTRQEVEADIRSFHDRKKQEAERERKQEERLKYDLAKRENQQKSRAVKRKMQQMQTYVNTLKNQMFEREQKLRNSKIQDRNFSETLAKSTEEIEKEMLIKKQCRGCHKSYPASMIGSVPKKTG